MKFKQLCTVIAVTCVVLLGTAARASAHAELSSSKPAAGSVLSVAPQEIVLTFSEAVDVIPDSIRLVDSAGDRIELGKTTHGGGENTLTADVGELENGTYVVAWKAVSADSHPINGAYIFSVGEETAPTPGLIEQLVEDGSATRSLPQGALGAGRWMSYAGLATLLGGALTLLVCAPGMIQTRRARNLLLSGAGVAAVGTIVMVVAQASIATGEAFTVSAMQTVVDGAAGRWWMSRVPLIALGAALIWLGGRSDKAWWRILAGVDAIALLAVFAAGGHAVSGRSRTAGYVSTVAHLGAMSIWSGGLLVLIGVVARHQLWRVAARFSALALGAVVVLVGTGIFNAWRQLGSFNGFTDSAYGRWLLVKVVLVVIVVAIATTTRWQVSVYRSIAKTERTVIAPGVGAATNSATSNTAELRRTVLAELVGIVVIGAVTAGLVNAAPPRLAAIGPVSVSAVQGDRVAQLVLAPAVTGGTTMHVYITSATGALDRPDEITVTADLPAKSIGPLRIPVIRVGFDHVTTSDANLPVAGLWTFTIAARYGFDEAVFTTELEVR